MGLKGTPGEMAAPMVWAPGIFWFFLLDNPVLKKFLALPQGPCHIKNTTVILIHYGGGNKNTTAAKHYGRVSETHCFPGENSQEISTDSVN